MSSYSVLIQLILFNLMWNFIFFSTKFHFVGRFSPADKSIKGLLGFGFCHLSSPSNLPIIYEFYKHATFRMFLNTPLGYSTQFTLELTD